MKSIVFYLVHGILRTSFCNQKTILMCFAIVVGYNIILDIKKYTYQKYIIIILLCNGNFFKKLDSHE
jgi:hypothetical protein